MLILAKAAHAQITNPVLPFAGQGDATIIIGNAISAVVGTMLVVGTILALLHLTFGGIKWVTASGDKTQLQNAQERITQAIMGLVILFSIWALMKLISAFLGFDFPNLPLPSLENP